MGQLVLFGGAAGVGKSTLARAWCNTRPRSALIEVDSVRQLIVGGIVDPQDTSDPEQAKQYLVSVHASWALGRSFLESGYDVAIENVFEPEDFKQNWEPLLAGYEFLLVILHPILDATLTRSRARDKRVMEKHTRSQHAACALWSDEFRIDTTALDVQETLTLVSEAIEAGSFPPSGLS